jgi:hypothetical protein
VDALTKLAEEWELDAATQGNWIAPSRAAALLRAALAASQGPAAVEGAGLREALEALEDEFGHAEAPYNRNAHRAMAALRAALRVSGHEVKP